MVGGAGQALDGDAAALAAARRLLPTGAPILHASRSGPSPPDAAARWAGAGDAPSTLDFDFLPATDRMVLALQVTLERAEDLQALCDGRILGLWLNGAPAAPAGPLPRG